MKSQPARAPKKRAAPRAPGQKSAPRAALRTTPYAAVADEHAALLELTHALVARLDLTGEIATCSRAWENRLHRPAGELIGRPLDQFVDPADRAVFRAQLQRVLAGHPPEEFSVRFESRGRGAVWLAVRSTINPSRDAIYVVARDVTAEKSVAGAPARTDLVIEEIEEGVLVADASRADLQIIFANAGFARLTGYAPAEALNRPLAFLAGAFTDRDALGHALRDALAGHRCTLELCCERRDGGAIWVRLQLRPVADSQGVVRQVIATHVDITEHRMVLDALRDKNQALTEALESLQRTKEAIVQRERMHALGKMASGMVHDFNNLLAPILGFTELLLTIPDLLDNKERVALYLEKIRTAATDGAAVVARMRDFYRSRNDAEPPAEFSVQQAVRETLDLTEHRWRNEAQAAGVEIIVETDLHETAPAFGCASELRQALTNLVLNAVDAMPEGGVLRVRTFPVGNWVCLQLSDTGVGMSEDVRRRCLEPFFTTKGKAGTGLGLAIVFGIVERLGGRLELHSQEGVGTIFTLWLPAAGGTESAAIQTPASDEDDGRPLRIMVVDDEDLLLEVVSQQLLNLGHSVACFTRPEAAVEAFYKQPFDLVITDRAMPGMSGDQLARRVREYKADTPVVLLTGFGTIIMQTGERPENIDDVLSKPLSHQTLCSVLARHGGRSRMRSAS